MQSFVKCGAVLLLFLGGLCATWTDAAFQGKGDAKAEGEINLESLRTMLDDLGYDFKEVKNKDKEGKEYVWGYAVAAGRNGASGENYTFSVNVSLSSDKQWLWIDQGLGTLDKKAVPKSVVLQMLEHNRMGLERLELFGNGYLRISAGYPARSINRKMLRSRVESMINSAALSDRLWNPKYWPKEKASTSARADDTKPVQGVLAFPVANRSKPQSVPAAAPLARQGLTVPLPLELRLLPAPAATAQKVTKEFHPFDAAQLSPLAAKGLASPAATGLPAPVIMSPSRAPLVEGAAPTPAKR
jgi:hypothetical protein